MTEQILTTKKTGRAMLLLTIFLYVVAIAALVLSIQFELLVPMILAIVVLALGWIVLPGLKVLRPQEALVLTLFGKYVGTIRGEGFYWVNPFCTAVNPAAKTKLNQSGDVTTHSPHSAKAAEGVNIEMVNKKISLKLMTLNNTRYPLVEFSFQSTGDEETMILHSLCKAAGREAKRRSFSWLRPPFIL